jgi:hypothetical protein
MGGEDASCTYGLDTIYPDDEVEDYDHSRSHRISSHPNGDFEELVERETNKARCQPLRLDCSRLP